MSKVVVNTHLTLDGVMQAPGQPDEDPRGGFTYGGWERPYADHVMGAAIADRMGQAQAYLLGRRTYENFAAFWPTQGPDNPFSEVMNGFRKFVASRTLQEPLAWNNSSLLEGDGVDAVAALRRQPDGDLAIVGSGEFAQSLMAHNLVDEYVLLIHPLVVGSGRKLFADGGPTAKLRLVDSKTTTTGVLIATYVPADGPAEPAA
jgi:dihydrofolate reductase